MNPLESLIDLQALDTRLDQIQHRRANLPERAELQEVLKNSEDLERRLLACRNDRLELLKEQRRREFEFEILQERREKEQNLLYSNQITGLRELQSLEREIAAIGRRQELVEDDILKLLEELDVFGESIDLLEKRQEELHKDSEEVRSRLSKAEAQLDTETLEAQTLREEMSAAVGEELLGRYEDLRSRLGGVAVAKLVGSTCTGCHLSLPLMELDQLRKLRSVGEAEAGKPDKASASCPSCERMLLI